MNDRERVEAGEPLPWFRIDWQEKGEPRWTTAIGREHVNEVTGRLFGAPGITDLVIGPAQESGPSPNPTRPPG